MVSSESALDSSTRFGGLDAVRHFTMLSDMQIESEVLNYSRDELREALAHDSWLANYVVNIWEYKHGCTTLTTYPWNVCLPIADVCNAACTFCNSWLRGKGWLELADLERFAPVVKHAKLLGLAGHGEPLIHPEFDALSRRFSQLIDPRCAVYLITNGHHLLRRLDQLRAMRVQTYNISLNAATATTHDQVMGMGLDSWSQVMQGIERLLEFRDRRGENILVNISCVVTQQNIHEVARFVEMGNRLNVNNIYVRTLAPAGRVDGVPGLNYHILPPYLHPDFERHAEEAKGAIARSEVRVEGNVDSWRTPIYRPDHVDQLRQRPPAVLTRAGAKADRTIQDYYAGEWEKVGGALRTSGQALPIVDRPSEAEATGGENPYGRGPRFSCRFVYYNLNLNDFMYRLYPCCYIVDVPGFESICCDGSEDFFDSWNSPAMVELRRRLVEGPLFRQCKTCPPQG